MPVPFDAERGREARVAVAQLQGDLARLIEGACGCSPYLKTLVEKEAAWLPGALEAPEAALDAVLDAIMQAPPDVLPVYLRQAKRRVALLAGLALVNYLLVQQ